MSSVKEPGYWKIKILKFEPEMLNYQNLFDNKKNLKVNLVQRTCTMTAL